MKLTKKQRAELIETLAYCVEDLKKSSPCNRKIRYEDIIRMVKYLDQDDQKETK